MGSTCSSTDKYQKDFDTSRYSKRFDDEKERETMQSNEKAQETEIQSLSNEVIVLSTRNANLEQELDETNTKIKKLKSQIFSENESDLHVFIDILKLSQILKIHLPIINNNDKLDYNIDIFD
eukprot:444107_1